MHEDWLYIKMIIDGIMVLGTTVIYNIVYLDTYSAHIMVYTNAYI